MSVAAINAVDLTLSVITSTPPSFLNTFSGSNDSVAVSSTGTTTVSGGLNGFIQWFQPISAGAGSGAYTRKLVLDRTTIVPREGATIQLTISIVASNNPTISVYDATDTGTLLQTIQGDSSNATVFEFEAEYNGSAYVKTEGEYSA